jgi:hypothetical protein
MYDNCKDVRVEDAEVGNVLWSGMTCKSCRDEAREAGHTVYQGTELIDD